MNGWNFDSLTGKLILVHLKFLFCYLSCFHLKGKERRIMCIHKDKFYFLVTSPLGSCRLCDVPCSDNNDSWFLCCPVRLFGWKTTCIFAYSILLVWHWEVYLLWVIGNIEFQNWKGLRSHLAQFLQFSYTDINKEPALCKLMLESREDIDESPVGD